MATAALPLDRIVTRAFPPLRPYAPHYLRFFDDLAELYGHPQESRKLYGQRRITFVEMVGELVGELADPSEPVDVLMLAHATPDAEPTWPACLLADALPGAPLTFAVADQGTVTPFTALRILASRLTGAAQHAVLLILDQVTLLRGPAPTSGVELPRENRLVALVFHPRCSIGKLSVAVDPDVPPKQAAARFLKWGSDPQDPTIATGHRPLTPTDPQPVWQLRPAQQGLPATGPWLTLASDLDRYRDGRRVRLAAYEPELRCLGEARLEFRPGSDPTGRPGRALLNAAP